MLKKNNQKKGTIASAALILLLAQSLNSHLIPNYNQMERQRRVYLSTIAKKQEEPSTTKFLNTALKKETLTSNFELDFTISATGQTTNGIQLKGDENQPTLTLDFSNNQLLLPFKNFDAKSSAMVTCTEAKSCKMDQTAVEITYKDTKCTGNHASAPLNFTPKKSSDKKNLLAKISEDAPNSFTLITKNDGCSLETGILGFGLGSDFFRYLRKSYQVDEDKTLFTGFHTIKAEKSKTMVDKAKMTINNRISPVGCSQNLTYAYDPKTPGNGVSEFIFEINAEYKTKDKTEIKNVPGDNSKAKLNADTSGDQAFFGLKNSKNFIDQVKKLVGDDGKSKTFDISKAPTVRLKMKCTPEMDILRYMWLKIEPEDYIVENDGKLQYLISEIPAEAKVDFHFGLLFLSKYELFLRVIDEEKWATVGFGDINYSVNKALWIGISAGVGGTLFVGMVVIALIFREKPGTKDEDEDYEEDDDDEYGKV